MNRRAFLKAAAAGTGAMLSSAALWNTLARAQVGPERLDELLEPIRAARGVPALAGAFVSGRDLIALGVVGTRRTRTNERVQSSDRFHIGSNTKSMTATFIAMLVEQGRLSWDTTIADTFPDLLGRIHPGFQRATLVQLLSHRAGLPEDPPDPMIWGQVWDLTGPLLQQRRALIGLVLSRPPVAEPGARIAYSNFGYAIAGAFAEQATRRPWEELMQEMLFKPLGMTSVGFGAPGAGHPWGHTQTGCQPVEPGPQADNPSVTGPAGTVHCSMSDWARYASLHLQGARGEPGLLLKPESFEHLHRDRYQQQYAMGWIVAEPDWARGPALLHAGSNTMWFAVIAIAPARSAAILAATNCGSDGSRDACTNILQSLIRRYLS
jgi:CubicO group peptidase (beta-lactamase class C family)